MQKHRQIIGRMCLCGEAPETEANFQKIPCHFTFVNPIFKKTNDITIICIIIFLFFLDLQANRFLFHSLCTIGWFLMCVTSSIRHYLQWAICGVFLHDQSILHTPDILHLRRSSRVAVEYRFFYQTLYPSMDYSPSQGTIVFGDVTLKPCANTASRANRLLQTA